MNGRPVKTLIFIVVLAVAAAAAFFTYRRTPVCAGDAKYMSSLKDCQSYGLDAGLCKDVVEKARVAVARAAPKSTTQTQCELQFSDCFQTADGAYVATPSFCLKTDGKSAAEPSEVRYLAFDSDRLARKKAREVRIGQ
jgi:uncharacterized protein YgiB involved in biofilm formation